MSVKPIKGLRSYYPSDKGPIDTYQLGRNGRVEYLTAEVAVDHLSKGNDTTDEWRKWARERGESSDEPGLILSKRLGGSGKDNTNLFPKSPLLDKTTWKEHEEAAVEEASEMKKWKKLKFAVRLDYPSDDSTRPSELEYQYDLPSGTILYGKVKNNPAPTNAAAAAATSENEEEEEEEEVEEEVEAEEDEEEEEEEVEEEAKEEPVAEKNISKPAESTPPPPPPPAGSEPKPEVPVPVAATIVQPPTSAPPMIQKSPSPPPPKPSEPAYPSVMRSSSPPQVERDDYPKKRSTPKSPKPTKDETSQQNRGVITKSDLVDLIPVIGSCKLAVETLQAVCGGNGRLALRKAVQCGISVVADFYFGRALARHGQILAESVTEQTIIRFVTKAENQIIIVSTFKATNQLLNTLTRMS